MINNLLQDKVAVITGSNRGIGKSIVEKFAENGAIIFACMRTLSPSTKSWIKNIERKYNTSITPILVDLSDEKSTQELAKKIIAFSKKVDILVNNAGIASGSLFQMTTATELKKVFEVNFFSQVTISQGISRIMLRNKSGSIINIASTSAFLVDSGSLAYGSSKASFVRATKSMAIELGLMGIRVNALAPSITKTDMFEQMSKVARDKLISSSALKRYAEPEDVANAALFLASDLSTYITGQVLRVDGGIV